jgi:RimJ/RimL family protein N-acetyltransferase
MRPYRNDDLDDVHRLLTNPDVRRYLLDDVIVEREWVADEIRQTRACFEAHGFGQFAVFEKTEKAFIGFCGYRFFHDPPECQLLYAFHPDYWGRDIATEAARAMIRYGIETCGFDEIIGSTDAPNKASQRVMEKAGMSYTHQRLIHGQETRYYRLSRADYSPDDRPYRLIRSR